MDGREHDICQPRWKIMFLTKVRWEPAEGAQLEPLFQVTVTRLGIQGNMILGFDHTSEL